jgi:hypothetical protein
MQLLVLAYIIASFRLGCVVAILCTRNRLFRSTERTEWRLREVSDRENQLEAANRTGNWSQLERTRFRIDTSNPSAK